MEMKRKSNKKFSDDWLISQTVLGLDDPFSYMYPGPRNFLLPERLEGVSETKPAEFLDRVKGRISSCWIAFKIFGVALMATFTFLVGVSWWIFSSSFQGEIKEEKPESQIPATSDPQGQPASMTRAEAQMGKGVVEIPPDLGKEYQLVSFGN